jgi:hypothetical protein
LVLIEQNWVSTENILIFVFGLSVSFMPRRRQEHNKPLKVFGCFLVPFCVLSDLCPPNVCDEDTKNHKGIQLFLSGFLCSSCLCGESAQEPAGKQSEGSSGFVPFN